jgi:hypothetical protein
MAISSVKRSPTTLTTNKTLRLMPKHALKESGKQRECLIKGVAKEIDPKEQKRLLLLGF